MDRNFLTQLEHVLRPIRNAVRSTVARAVVHLVNDAKKLQLVQAGALAGETIDDAEHHQPYGFSSVPLDGAEAILVFPGGDRGHPIAVAVSDRRHRPTGGQAGEVVMYTDEGDQIRLGRGHVITIATDPAGVIKLGSSSAAQSAIKGTQRNTAEQTFLTALATWVAAVGTAVPATSAAGGTFATAITAFATAASSALSTKVKLE